MQLRPAGSHVWQWFSSLTQTFSPALVVVVVVSTFVVDVLRVEEAVPVDVEESLVDVEMEDDVEDGDDDDDGAVTA